MIVFYALEEDTVIHLVWLHPVDHVIQAMSVTKVPKIQHPQMELQEKCVLLEDIALLDHPRVNLAPRGRLVILQELPTHLTANNAPQDFIV